MDPVLGVDLGTTYTAAATTNDARSKPEMIGLGVRSPEIPSVLLLRADGEFLAGEPAERRAFGEPERVARQFKRRLGDATPLLLGGSPFSPEALLGRLLSFVVARSEEQRGAKFAATVVCHPANWGPYRMELLGQAAKMADVDHVYFLPEPVAAAVHYTEQAKLAPGEIVVVYDFGGGTFDVAVLRRTDEAFEVIGTPSGLEHLGGLDLDEAVFGHVTQSIGSALGELDPNDQAVIAAVGRLRDECKAAKEALSSDTDTSIPVLLPGLQTEIRLTRAEFESMILPAVTDTVATTTRAIREAGLEPSDVGRILLVGGSARVPLVSQLLAEELGRPTVIDTHPKHAIALGAARWGALQVEAGGEGASAAEAPVVAAALAAVETDAVAPPEPVVAPEPEPEPEPEPAVLVSPPEEDLPVRTQEAAVEPEPEPVTAPVSAIPVVPTFSVPSGLAEPAPAAHTAPKPEKAPEPAKRSQLQRIATIALAIGATVLVAAVLYATTQNGGGPKAITATIIIDGDKLDRTPTDLILAVGDKVTVEATGQVSHSTGNFTGPDGVDDATLMELYNVTTRDVRHNALIARIGNGEPFFIGAFAQFTADAAGRLSFDINDTGRDNNTGKYTAQVRVERAKT